MTPVVKKLVAQIDALLEAQSGSPRPSMPPCASGESFETLVVPVTLILTTDGP